MSVKIKKNCLLVVQINFREPSRRPCVLFSDHQHINQSKNVFEFIASFEELENEVQERSDTSILIRSFFTFIFRFTKTLNQSHLSLKKTSNTEYRINSPYILQIVTFVH